MPDLVTRVQTALRDHAGPEMGLDGSLIEVVEVTDGIASVRLAGACASCPASLTTIIMGLEQELRKHVPEVDIIEAVG
jgi:Fe-S cluster biogenesis protein NfuA